MIYQITSGSVFITVLALNSVPGDQLPAAAAVAVSSSELFPSSSSSL